jgi:hypothetical protein
MKGKMTPAYLLRSVLVALFIAVLLHIVADYFGWHLFSEAGGELRLASGLRTPRVFSGGGLLDILIDGRQRDGAEGAVSHGASDCSSTGRQILSLRKSTCGSGGTADALASGASPSNRVGVQIPASAPITNLY